MLCVNTPLFGSCLFPHFCKTTSSSMTSQVLTPSRRQLTKSQLIKSSQVFQSQLFVYMLIKLLNAAEILASRVLFLFNLHFPLTQQAFRQTWSWNSPLLHVFGFPRYLPSPSQLPPSLSASKVTQTQDTYSLPMLIMDSGTSVRVGGISFLCHHIFFYYTLSAYIIWKGAACW